MMGEAFESAFSKEEKNTKTAGAMKDLEKDLIHQIYNRLF